MKRIWIVLSILLGTGAIGIFGYLGFRSSQQPVEQMPQAPETVAVSVCDVTQSVSAPGNVVNSGERVVRLPFGATLTGVPVRAGDAVHPGDTLLELGPADVALAVAQARVDVASAQEALDAAWRYRSGQNYSRSNDLVLDQAKADYTRALWRYENAQASYHATSDLDENDPVRMAALETLAATRRHRDLAQAILNWYLGKPTSQEIRAGDAGVALALARLDQAEAALALLEQLFVTEAGTGTSLSSPLEGVVLDVKVQPGETVAAGAALLTLADPGNVEVQVTILEEDYPYVQVGQRVELYFDALPDGLGSGAVDRILPKRASGDRPLYYVYLTLDRVPEHLVDGMTADASIVIEERTQVLCLPRALVRAASGPTAAVTVWDGVNTATRQVEVGLRGDVYIEILSGLEEGDLVVTR